MKAFLLALFFIVATAQAQDALVVSADVNRLRDGSGGGISALWIHPRGNDTFIAGATFLTLPQTRWAYATLGDTRRLSAGMSVNVEANLGSGNDARGDFQYILLRGGVTRELVPRMLYGEAEWLQSDVARQQDGIARIGATWLPREPLTLRASLYQSIFGDSDTTLGTIRTDYDLGRLTASAGATAGTAVPSLLQQPGTQPSRVRELFGGVAFDNAGRRWTVIASTLAVAGERRHRVSVSWRVPL
ncbi:MAG TPA: hypothetical protein VE010_17105 [Thermoanaerobaculia bacterium]|nr:hypothetical protein [Thermoanaerobaculia bacterium]